jgi:alcohol dehydrogenase (cytochrome c)
MFVMEGAVPITVGNEIIGARAPGVSGILDTAGGLILSGGFDRSFTARDDKTGKELWRVRLNEVPNSCPSTYSVNGKQYVAISVGTGSAISTIWSALVPEMQNRPGRGWKCQVLRE